MSQGKEGDVSVSEPESPSLHLLWVLCEELSRPDMSALGREKEEGVTLRHEKQRHIE